MAEYIISHKADRDLVDIFKYIARQSTRSRAKSYVRKLEKTIKTLSESPELGTPRDYTPLGVLAFPKDDYIIFYWKRSPSIEVIRILHAARDLENLL